LPDSSYIARLALSGKNRHFSPAKFGAPLFPNLCGYAFTQTVPSHCLPYLLPIEMINELIKKEADPNYLLDLTNIQNRYISEGRAELSLDGKTIRFHMPYYH